MAVITATTSPTNGTPQADTITGPYNNILINGGDGDDTISGGGTINGDGGNDVLRISSGFGFGGAGDDRLIENGGDSEYVYLDGGAGNDVIGTAPSRMFYGISFVTYTGATSGVAVDLAVETPQAIGGGQGIDTLIRIRGAVGTGFGDTIRGAEEFETLIGGGGNDLIEGRGGRDYIEGGAGDDTLDGGDGVDTLVFMGSSLLNQPELGFASSQPTGGISVNLGAFGPQEIGGGMGRDIIRNFENVVGSNFGDLLVGNEANNQLIGQGGNDTLYGGAGSDELIGGVGDSLMRGGEGNDTLTGGGSFDDLHGNQGNDWVSGGAGNDWVVGGQDQDTLLGGDGADIVYGNMGADTAYGGSGDDIVRGGQDDDVLFGDQGDDFLSGDRGRDTITGGAGADRFYIFRDSGIDRVTDFSRAEGDRVQIEPGNGWTLVQDGADAVVRLDSGAAMVLVGVNVSTLTGEWVFSG